MSKPILLTVGGQTHQDLWMPLSETYQLAFVSTPAAQLAANLGVTDALAIESFATAEIQAKAKATGLAIAASVIGGINAEKIPMGGLRPIEWLPSIVADQSAAAYARIQACESLAKDRDVVGVLVHEDVTPEGRLLCQLGNKHGIPTMHIPHANHFLEPGTKDIHCQVTAQYIGASGIYMRDWYKACGVAEDKIALLGGVQWDHLYHDAMIDRKHARLAFQIKDVEFCLGYATTWAQMTTDWGEPEKDLGGALDIVIETAKKMSAYLLIKMHPGEAAGNEQGYFEKLKASGLRGAVTRMHNEFALQAADCLVTQGPSNVGVQATIFGTPVVEMYVCGAKYPAYGPRGTWGDNLEVLIHEAVVLKDFERSMNYDGDGKAIERAVSWVKGLCQSQ